MELGLDLTRARVKAGHRELGDLLEIELRAGLPTRALKVHDENVVEGNAWKKGINYFRQSSWMEDGDQINVSDKEVKWKTGKI